MDLKIGVVMPVYNEEHRIENLLKRFTKDLRADLLVVDDGSTDKTTQLVAASGWQTLRHEKRQGIGAAIRHGLEYFHKKGYSILVVMAGNGKDDPQQIPLVVAPIISGDADYVQGSRFLTGGSFENLPFARHMMIRSFTTLWSLSVGKNLTDVTNGFRAYRAQLLDDSDIRLNQEWLDTYSLEYYLHYKALRKYRYKEVPVTKNYPSRSNYSKIRPFLDWWSIIKPLVLLRLGIKS